MWNPGSEGFVVSNSDRLATFGNHSFPILCIFSNHLICVDKLRACQCNDDIKMPPKLWLHHFTRWVTFWQKQLGVASMTWHFKLHMEPSVIPLPLGGLIYDRSSMVHHQVVRSSSKTSMEVFPSTITCIDMFTWRWFLDLWVFTPNNFPSV